MAQKREKVFYCSFIAIMGFSSFCFCKIAIFAFWFVQVKSTTLDNFRLFLTGHKQDVLIIIRQTLLEIIVTRNERPF